MSVWWFIIFSKIRRNIDESTKKIKTQHIHIPGKKRKRCASSHTLTLSSVFIPRHVYGRTVGNIYSVQTPYHKSDYDCVMIVLLILKSNIMLDMTVFSVQRLSHVYGSDRRYVVWKSLARIINLVGDSEKGIYVLEPRHVKVPSLMYTT